MSNKNIVFAMLATLGVAIAVTIFVALGADDNQVSDHQIILKTERDFIEYLIPHHEEAITNSGVLLAGEVRLRPVRELAEEIKASQQLEVDQMQVWYQEWYGEGYTRTFDYQTLTRPVTDLPAPERERVYLEDMISHHEVAIAAAKQVLQLKIKDNTKALAENTIIKNEEEVRVMKELLRLQPSSE